MNHLFNQDERKQVSMSNFSIFQGILGRRASAPSEHAPRYDIGELAAQLSASLPESERVAALRTISERIKPSEDYEKVWCKFVAWLILDDACGMVREVDRKYTRETEELNINIRSDESGPHFLRVLEGRIEYLGELFLQRQVSSRIVCAELKARLQNVGELFQRERSKGTTEYWHAAESARLIQIIAQLPDRSDQYITYISCGRREPHPQKQAIEALYRAGDLALRAADVAQYMYNGHVGDLNMVRFEVNAATVAANLAKSAAGEVTFRADDNAQTKNEQFRVQLQKLKELLESVYWNS